MTLRVSGKNMDIGDALRGYIETRIGSTLEKYRAGPAAGHVTIEREGSGFRSDCTLHLRSGATVQADSRAHEPYVSFDRAADHIESQVRRHRERLVNHHVTTVAEDRSGAELPERGQAPAPTGGEALPEDSGARSMHAAVIAEPAPQFKEMTVSGAAMELELTNAQVIIFRHASHGRMNVVYRRPDGNIGWIDPGRE
jgi:ribosomal subunit interface protein